MRFFRTTPPHSFLCPNFVWNSSLVFNANLVLNSHFQRQVTSFLCLKKCSEFWNSRIFFEGQNNIFAELPPLLYVKEYVCKFGIKLTLPTSSNTFQNRWVKIGPAPPPKNVDRSFFCPVYHACFESPNNLFASLPGVWSSRI